MGQHYTTFLMCSMAHVDCLDIVEHSFRTYIITDYQYLTWDWDFN